MTEFLSGSSFFAIALTLLIWRFAMALQKKVKSPLLHPILFSTVAVILVLLLAFIVLGLIYFLHDGQKQGVPLPDEEQVDSL